MIVINPTGTTSAKSFSFVLLALFLLVPVSNGNPSIWPLTRDILSKAPKIWFVYVEKISYKVCQENANLHTIRVLIKKYKTDLVGILGKVKQIAKFTCKEKLVRYTIRSPLWKPYQYASHNYITVLTPLGDIMFTTIGQSDQWYSPGTTLLVCWKPYQIFKASLCSKQLGF